MKTKDAEHLKFAAAGFAAGALICGYLWPRRAPVPAKAGGTGTAAPDARTAACIEGSNDATDAEVTQLKGKLWALTESTFTAMLIATGDKLGLYATLRRAARSAASESEPNRVSILSSMISRQICTQRTFCCPFSSVHFNQSVG